MCGKPGQGMGPGIGQGARPEGELAEHGFEKTKLKGELGEGEFIGSFFVKGVPPNGPTQVKYVEMLERYEQDQARALEKEPIPAEQRESIRRYFDALKPPAEPEPSKP